MPARRSLRFQLLAGLLVPLGVVALVQFAVAYRNAEATAAAVTDRILLASARSIAEHIGFESSGLDVTVPPAALGMFDLGYGDTVYYRVTGTRGKLLAGYGDLPAPPGTSSRRSRHTSTRLPRRAIRLVAVAQPIALARGVQQARSSSRDAQRAARDVARAVDRQRAAAVAAHRDRMRARVAGLAPRAAPARAPRARSRGPQSERPAAVLGRALQAELDPLMRALNAYMLRLGAQLDAQRRFTANAAHQMRTPLTLLRTQASYALRAAASENARRRSARSSRRRARSRGSPTSCSAWRRPSRKDTRRSATRSIS